MNQQIANFQKSVFSAFGVQAGSHGDKHVAVVAVGNEIFGSFNNTSPKSGKWDRRVFGGRVMNVSDKISRVDVLFQVR